MKYPTESAIVYDKIKQNSGLSPEALSSLNITKERIDTALQQMCDAGMSRKKAMKTIYKMWLFAEPDDKTE